MSITETTTDATSTALVTNGNGLAPLDEVERAFDELVERADIETLGDAQARLTAMAAYERRQGAKERASYYGRVKVLAEAAIGYVDVQRYPFRSPSQGGMPPLQFGSVVMEAGTNMRCQWRLLGQAKLQGILKDALDAVEADESQGVTTDTTVREVRRRGAGYVAVGPVRDALKAAVKRDSLRQTDIASCVDVMPWTIHSIMYRHKRVTYDIAVKVASGLGVDIAQFPPAPLNRRGVARKRIATPRRLKGGRWDRAYTSHRRTMQEVFEFTGEGGEPDLWVHLHAIEDFLKRRV